jgi:hypothetical protein
MTLNIAREALYGGREGVLFSEQVLEVMRVEQDTMPDLALAASRVSGCEAQVVGRTAWHL